MLPRDFCTVSALLETSLTHTCAEHTQCSLCHNSSQTTPPHSLFIHSLTPSFIIYYKNFSIKYTTETQVQRVLSIVDVLENALEILYDRIWDNLRCIESALNFQWKKLLVLVF